MINEPKNEYNKSSKLRKGAFKQFLALRYGQVVAEKWQYVLDFTNGVDFEAYQKMVEQIFLNKVVLHQLAFDFYDCNNDDQISEIDLYKVFQHFGDLKLLNKVTLTDTELFSNSIQKDLLILTQITKWLVEQKDKPDKQNFR